MTTEAKKLQDPFYKEQLEATAHLASIANQALARNQLGFAEKFLKEADAILDMSEYGEDDAVLELRSQIYNEFGFLKHRSGDLEQAESFHRRSIETCEELLSRDVPYRPNTTASLINLSALLAESNRFDEALETIEKATKLISSYLEENGDNEDASFLGFGAYHLKATLLIVSINDDTPQKEERSEQADQAAQQALIYAKNSNKEIVKKIQIANGIQQFAVQCFQKDNLDLAIKWASTSEDLAREAFEIEREPAIPVFVQTQLFLILFHESKGNYSAAEDALYNAIDVIGNHPQLLFRGRDFYIQAKKQTDKRLEEGGLPRAEVEDGLKEIEQRIETFGGEEKLQEALKELGVEN